jgi:hypothetical protein
MLGGRDEMMGAQGGRVEIMGVLEGEGGVRYKRRERR